MMLDNRSRSGDPIKVPSDRSFGLTFAAVFSIVGLLPLVSGGSVRIWALGAAAAFLLVTWLAPKALHGANLAWAHLGALLHKVVSPVALGVVFVVTFVPIGFIMRLLGKDPLRLRPSGGDTYWIARGPDAGERSMRNQF